MVNKTKLGISMPALSLFPSKEIVNP